jgi:NAD(P)-dependent dehydrogenase (short-subunit alcohol dehydrogenase family)
MGRFSGSTILITGAGGGLGQALVRQFLAEGSRIIAHDRSEAMLQSLRDQNLDFTPLIADLRDVKTLRERVAAAVRDGVDVLVNNAAIAIARSFKSLSASRIDEEIDVNLRSVFHLTEPVVERMKAQKSGAIVTIGSVNALAHFGHPGYSAAKAGLLALTRALAVELGKYNIRANMICPGTIRTPAWNDRLAENPDILDEVGRWYPLKRVALPEEVARVVAFLASSEAAIVTGTVLNADCGLMAGMPPVTNAFAQGLTDRRRRPSPRHGL